MGLGLARLNYPSDDSHPAEDNYDQIFFYFNGNEASLKNNHRSKTLLYNTKTILLQTLSILG